jgi:hypothetical protein
LEVSTVKTRKVSNKNQPEKSDSDEDIESKENEDKTLIADDKVNFTNSVKTS